MKILIIGANGRMGKKVASLCQKQNIEYVGVDPNSQNCKNQFDEDCQKCDIAIDFSCADALSKNLEFCVKHKINIVVATTGHNQENMQLIQNAKKHIAIFVASNLSIGFYKFTRAIENFDNPTYDVAIVEQHHKHKKDNPSGSAKLLQKILEQNHKNVQTFGIRGGEEIGMHSVVFFADHEKITITHQINSRDVFAQGAIDVARFVSTKHKGVFSMKDYFENEK